ADVVEGDGLELAVPQLVEQGDDGGPGFALEGGIEQGVEIITDRVAGGFEKAGGGDFHRQNGHKLFTFGGGDEAKGSRAEGWPDAIGLPDAGGEGGSVGTDLREPIPAFAEGGVGWPLAVAGGGDAETLNAVSFGAAGG